MDDKKLYGQTSISTLKDEEQVRKRPAVIFGTNDEQGCYHAVFEIIANAIDEARAGYCNKITITLLKDGGLEVSDNGRGVPMGWNENEKEWNWRLVFCTLYASGKLDTSSYGQALGLNGLGATAAQYASEYMNVVSKREGKASLMMFKKGKPASELKVMDLEDSKETGTTIRFKPDPEVFTGTDGIVTSYEHYESEMRKMAMLLPGVEFYIVDEVNNKNICLTFKNGISDFLDMACVHPMLSKNIDYRSRSVENNEGDEESFQFDMHFALNFSREYEILEAYHNNSEMEDGSTTVQGMYHGIVKSFEQYAKSIGKLAKNDKFMPKDVMSVACCILDTGAPGTKTFFKNQTKKSVNNACFRFAVAKFVYESLESWVNANKNEAAKLVNEFLANKQAREEAERVSKKVVQSLSKGVGTFSNMPKKFVDCRSKFYPERELFIVEGDSALGSCKLARDPEFQAVMPLRGKILNCLKNDLPRILSSDVIIDLMRVLGCGIEAKSKHIEGLPKFDISKLTWGKIIICTDADLDGMQIRCLVLAMIYRLAPSLLSYGKVFIAETPLYEISYKKDVRFAYNESEKASVIAGFTDVGVKESQIRIQRSKGLGENNPDMMSQSTMNPLTRRLVPLTIKNPELLQYTFECLLGDDLEGRREQIQRYFEITEAAE